MSLGLIIVILLAVAVIAVLPTWGYSRTWGNRPSYVLGVILVVLAIWMLLSGGGIPR